MAGLRGAGADTPRPLLPEGVRNFLIVLAIRLAALLLLAAAGTTAVALLSYSPTDPSLNVAGTAPVDNLLGARGAYFADFSLQWFGLASGLVILCPTSWGVRIFRELTLQRWYWRVLCLVIALPFVAMALGAAAPADNWPLQTGMGGLIGDQLHDGTSRVLKELPWQLPSWAIDRIPAFAALMIALPLTLYALGIRWSEWRATCAAGYGLTRRTGEFIWFGVRTGTQWVLYLIRNRQYDDAQRSQSTDSAMPKAAPRSRARAESAPRASAKRVTRKTAKPATGKRGQTADQAALDLGRVGEYQLPPLSLLTAPKKRSDSLAATDDALEQNAKLLETVLQDFGIKGEIVKVHPGPVVTLYELEPAPGIKSSRVIGLADDIARSMSAISARVAVIPGRNAIGIELPNTNRETVFLRELLASDAYEKTSARLTLALGKDIGGDPVIADLATMPHLLIAGTTGSGKSVAINTMILSLLYRLPPKQCKFIMIDPKMLELSVYDDIPHLLTPVVTDPGKAVVALKWAVREMEDRYRKMSRLGVRSISAYNQRVVKAQEKGEVLKRTVQTGFDADTGQPIIEDQEMDLDPLPLIVIIVDEMADLMMVAGKDIEGAVQRLAQMARAAGLHLIMATQRPSVDVITGTIKANFPTRISFQVTSKIDSRTILGEQGAEQLLGQGDMLYMAGGGRVTRVHGPFVSDEEVEQAVAFLKTQGAPEYLEEVTEEQDGEITPDMMGLTGGGGGDEDSALYDRAVAMVAQQGRASTSLIQRHLRIGYNRAARIMEQMEEQGVVSPPNHAGKREVLIGDH
ncbi:MAG TPA: cell division protein FtsK [Alphaproteobacteria bacterium]|nr:cell division protein FtsK [Alphaproteobacteria bacterium]